jgi:hypothetical protein
MIHILTVTPFGVIPLPIEITKLGSDSMEKLEEALVESYSWLTKDVKKRQEAGEQLSDMLIQQEIVGTLQTATNAFIKRLKHKDTPLLLVPTK